MPSHPPSSPLFPYTTLFRSLDDAERVQIVIETAALRAHQFVELAFAGMAERGMADVVNESERLGKLGVQPRSEEHTSELQSPMYLVCRLLLEKKKLELRHMI